MGVRQPVVAGSFYPSQEEELRNFIETMITEEMKHKLQNTAKGIREATGVVSPHAGYIYSGRLSAFSFYILSLLSPVETVVLIGPNHRGIGAKVALAEEDAWQTPLGIVSVDAEAVEFLRRRTPLFQVDSLAHRFEHSLEVQLPFLQYFLSYDFQILPLSLTKQDLATVKTIAEVLLALREQRKIFIIASSDFSHYEPAKVAMEKDLNLINQILNLDVESFYQKIYDQKISICGPGGIATLMIYHQSISKGRGELLLYAHSGEVSGDFEQVVGYASIIFPLSFSFSLDSSK